MANLVDYQFGKYKRSNLNCVSHLTRKVANICLNVREQVEVVEWNERWPPPFPYCPVSCQCLWKKTLIGKKTSFVMIMRLIIIDKFAIIHMANLSIINIVTNRVADI